MIREARREDAETIQRLLEALAASVGRPSALEGTVADLERFGFDEAPRFTALLAERDGSAVGLLLYFPEYSSWRGRPGLYVQDLYVGEDARGAGIGRRLLAEAARRTAALGGGYLRLSVEAGNQAGRIFYERIGFAHAASERMLVLEGPAFTALARG